MKLIGLDVGAKRIGVARADTSVRIAVPDSTLIVNGNELIEIAKLAKRYGTTWFVVGLPRNSRGEETQQSAYVRDFARRLQSVIPAARIRFQDESLTSVEAEQRLATRKRGYQKGDIDAEAATIILQDFIENFSTSQSGHSDEPNVDLADKNDGSDIPEEPAAGGARRHFLGKTANPRTVGPRTTNLRAATKADLPDGAEFNDVIDSKNGANMKKKKMKKGPKILIGVVIALGLLGFLAYGLYNHSLSAIYQVPACSGEDERCKEIEFTVSVDEPVSKIASNLESAGIIRSGLAFQLYLKLNPKNDAGEEISLKHGDYKLRRTMSVPEIVKQLDEGTTSANVFQITILPGETVKSIKQKLINDYGYSAEEVNAAFAKDYNHPVLAGKADTSAYGAEPLEGYIFGDTYEFYIGESVEKIITTTLDHLQEKVEGNNLVARFESHGLTLAQGITLASIVQKEASTLDQPTVAQVFLNRLSQGIMLGSDVTTKYALDLVDPDRLTYTDNALALTVDSLYNTRLYAGLTPGPICNPGVSALLAVANPTETSAIYFLTGDDGKMYYGNTEEEHQANIRNYCRELCAVGL